MSKTSRPSNQNRITDNSKNPHHHQKAQKNSEQYWAEKLKTYLQEIQKIKDQEKSHQLLNIMLEQWTAEFINMNHDVADIDNSIKFNQLKISFKKLIPALTLTIAAMGAAGMITQINDQEDSSLTNQNILIGNFLDQFFSATLAAMAANIVSTSNSKISGVAKFTTAASVFSSLSTASAAKLVESKKEDDGIRIPPKLIAGKYKLEELVVPDKQIYFEAEKGGDWYFSIKDGIKPLNEVNYDQLDRIPGLSLIKRRELLNLVQKGDFDLFKEFYQKHQIETLKYFRNNLDASRALLDKELEEIINLNKKDTNLNKITEIFSQGIRRELGIENEDEIFEAATKLANIFDKKILMLGAKIHNADEYFKALLEFGKEANEILIPLINNHFDDEVIKTWNRIKKTDLSPHISTEKLMGKYRQTEIMNINTELYNDRLHRLWERNKNPEELVIISGKKEERFSGITSGNINNVIIFFPENSQFSGKKTLLHELDHDQHNDNCANIDGGRSALSGTHQHVIPCLISENGEKIILHDIVKKALEKDRARLNNILPNTNDIGKIYTDTDKAVTNFVGKNNKYFYPMINLAGSLYNNKEGVRVLANNMIHIINALHIVGEVTNPDKYYEACPNLSDALEPKIFAIYFPSIFVIYCAAINDKSPEALFLKAVTKCDIDEVKQIIEERTKSGDFNFLNREYNKIKLCDLANILFLANYDKKEVVDPNLLEELHGKKKVENGYEAINEFIQNIHNRNNAENKTTKKSPIDIPSNSFEPSNANQVGKKALKVEL